MVIHKNINVVIFDFDGTIFDLNIDWEKLRTELAIDPSEKLGDVVQRYMDKNDRNNIDKIKSAEVVAVTNGRMLVGVESTFKFLEERGIHIAIFTRNSRQAILKALSSTGFENRIFIAGREDTEVLKPDPEGINVILNHFQVKPEAALIVGDTYHDVEAAQKAGVAIVIVDNPKLKHRPDGANYYIPSINKLTTLIG